MTRAVWPLGCLLILTACGDHPASSTAPASARPAGTTTASAQPWDAPSQAGLWRHVTMVDGQPSASVLLCYAPGLGPLVPRSAATRTLRCDPAQRERVAGGWVRREQCSTLPREEGRLVRATVSGDMAAAFSVTTEVLDGDGNRREGEPVLVDTWLRMGECPESLPVGQTRADGTPLTPQAQLAGAAVAAGAASTRRASRPSAAPNSASPDPIGDLASGEVPTETPPSEGLTTDAPPSAPATPTPPADRPTGQVN